MYLNVRALKALSDRVDFEALKDVLEEAQTAIADTEDNLNTLVEAAVDGELTDTTVAIKVENLLASSALESDVANAIEALEAIIVNVTKLNVLVPSTPEPPDPE